MPEGPEVQTIVNGLNKCIRNKEIVDLEFTVDSQKILEGIDIQELKKLIYNQKIDWVFRRGKYIDIRFSSGFHLVTHLLITGQLIYTSDGLEKPQYLKFVMKFSDHSELCLGDRRGWVKIQFLTDDKIENLEKFKNLGPDIFSEKFTLEKFRDSFNSKRAIHSHLLDQGVISGLGNIYVTECLWDAKIHPQRPANSLNRSEKDSLFEAIKRITLDSLSKNGTTFSDYRIPDGSIGQYQNYLKAFRKGGEKCPRCGKILEKITVGGRGAVFCPNDQKLEQENLKNLFNDLGNQ